MPCARLIRALKDVCIVLILCLCIAHIAFKQSSSLFSNSFSISASHFHLSYCFSLLKMIELDPNLSEIGETFSELVIETGWEVGWVPFGMLSTKSSSYSLFTFFEVCLLFDTKIQSSLLSPFFVSFEPSFLFDEETCFRSSSSSSISKIDGKLGYDLCLELTISLNPRAEVQYFLWQVKVYHKIWV